MSCMKITSTNKEYKCKISENEKFLATPELFNLLLTRSIGIAV